MTVYNYNGIESEKQQRIAGVSLRRIDGYVTQPAGATMADAFKIATGLNANSIIKAIRITSAIAGATSMDVQIFKAGEESAITNAVKLAAGVSLTSNSSTNILGSGVSNFDKTLNLVKLAGDNPESSTGYDIGITGNTLGTTGGTYWVELDVAEDL
jgi:hypothetical protein